MQKWSLEKWRQEMRELRLRWRFSMQMGKRIVWKLSICCLVVIVLILRNSDSIYQQAAAMFLWKYDERIQQRDCKELGHHAWNYSANIGCSFNPSAMSLQQVFCHWFQCHSGRRLPCELEDYLEVNFCNYVHDTHNYLNIAFIICSHFIWTVLLQGWAEFCRLQ